MQDGEGYSTKRVVLAIDIVKRGVAHNAEHNASIYTYININIYDIVFAN